MLCRAFVASMSGSACLNSWTSHFTPPQTRLWTATRHTLLPLCRFGTKRVAQKRRHMMRILHPKQTPYVPKPEGYSPLPLSLLGSGPIRRLIYSNSQEALDTAASIDWSQYKCEVKGVRWHPSGSWRVQFDRRSYEHNFFVKCNCYFRVSLYGFSKAKELAIAYRQRLEKEWEELEETWKAADWITWTSKKYSAAGAAATHSPKRKQIHNT